MNKTKVIAFYLPQFHTIPENDRSYGEGFTEWTNTRKAVPLFQGHNQPRIPLNDNYYCLLDESVMEEQAKMAKEYGVYGFCYYHYWFKGGKKLLEKPVEMMLKNPKVDIPFCLCWANENWTKRWDGGNNEIIVEQDYGNLKELDEHVDYLCQFFADPRYIRINDMPILLIYKPELIPNLSETLQRIRERVSINGFKGVKLICQYPLYYFKGENLNYFDHYVQFQPKFVQDDIHESSRSSLQSGVKDIMLKLGLQSMVKKVQKSMADHKREQQKGMPVRRSYDEDWSRILSKEVKDTKLIAGAFVDWDNTPRLKTGLVYDGATPEKFEKYMSSLVNKVKAEYEQDMIFINAWNEWAEGAYLEPDQRNGYLYLEGLKKALDI